VVTKHPSTRTPKTFQARLAQHLRRAWRRAHDWHHQLPARVKRIVRHTTLWSANTALGIALIFSLLVVAAHLWLPTLTERKAEIETYVGNAIGNPVTFGELGTFWDGLNPGVYVQGFEVRSSRTGETAVRLKGVRLALAWWPLLTGRIEIRSLLLAEPHLVLERQPDGRLHIAGFDLYQSGDETQQDFGAWLFRQRELAISNGELEWVDRQDPKQPETLVVKRLNAVLRNDGDHHRLDFHARFPETMCGDCRFSADIHGQPLTGSDWRGDLRVQARDLTVSGLPRIVRDRLPVGVDGTLNLRAESHWRLGLPIAINGTAETKDAIVPMPASQPPIRIRRLETGFRWEGDPSAWKLEFERLRLGLTREPWYAGNVRIEFQPGRLRLSADRLDVGDLATVASASAGEGKLFDWLRASRPEGTVEKLDARIDGGMDEPKEFHVTARVLDWRFDAHERFPGLRGLTGSVTVDHDGGEFQLDSRTVRVDVPRVFEKPVEVVRLASRIRWQQNPDDWFVRAERIEVTARAGRVHGELELRVPKDASLSPIIKLELAGENGNGTYTADFLPLVLPEKLRNYLAGAVKGGYVTKASAVLHGALHNFPFRDGKGKFEIRAHVMHGVYEYLPGWEPLRGIEADLYFTGKEMLIASNQASVRDVEVNRVVVAIDDYRAPEGALITVGARAFGSFDSVIKTLAATGLPRLNTWIVPGMDAEGNGELHLALRIPARNLPDFKLTGEYRLFGNAIEFPFRNLRIEDLRGSIAFNQSGLHRGKVTGRFLDGATTLMAGPGDDSHTHVRLEGQMRASGLSGVFGPTLAPYFSGDVPWRAELVLLPEVNEWNAEFDLGHFEIGLPAPLAKVRDEPMKLALRTLPGGSRTRMPVDVQAGGRLNGRVVLDKAASGWTLASGRLGIGEHAGTLPAKGGLHIGMRTPSFNADDWWSLVRSGSDGSDGWINHVGRLVIDTEALEAFGRPLGRLRADVHKNRQGWRGELDGESIAGLLSLVHEPRERREADATSFAVTLDLERLLLPPAGTSEVRSIIDPREMPTVTVRSKAFRYGQRDFGAIEFSAKPEPEGWRISKLTLTRPEANASLEGFWRIDRYGHQSSRFDLNVNSTDFGKTLAALGHPAEANGGKLVLESQWSWPDAPAALEIAELNGEMSFKLSQGRMLRVEPGAGRVLGLFDIMTIPRYLTLDFSTLFGKGMAYNTIQSSLEVENGNAYTRNFLMDAPGANIDLNGRIGLATQDLDLEMGVTPKLMEELAITGGLIGGPAVGAAVAVLHTLVKKPFEKSTRVPYTVRGSWQNPSVVPVPTPEADTTPP